MRETSALYKSIRATPGYHYNVNVICNETEEVYGMDALKSVHIKPMLFAENGPSIGNACSTECDIVLREQSENWPRMASFEVKIQIMSEDNTQVSEWLSMGTFFTDERSFTESGDLSIIGFDAMLKMEQSWTDKITPPLNWPVTASAWCDMIEAAGIAEFDSRNLINNVVAFIGLDTASTVRDKLKDIAAAHGANWIMTDAGKLRLIPLTDPSSPDGAIAGLAIAGVAIVGTSGGGGGSDSGVFPIGMNMRSFSSNTPLDGITGVILQTEGGSVSIAGTDTGYMLRGTCNFASSDGVAGICLARTFDYVYRGFDAVTAYLDPAYEVGDYLLHEEIPYQMMTITWNINHRPTADISAPYEEEIDHEYEIISESAKTLRKAVILSGQEASSLIQQTAEDISLSVSTNYYNKEEINVIQQGNESQFTLTSQQIQAALTQISELNGEVDEINYYVRYEIINGVGTVVVGQTNSLAELRITNDQISLMYNGDVISYWNQSKQYTPKQLQIPVGGSFRLGNILFQPRTSGNVSVFLVNS